jgi:hypothetical protein
VELFLSPCVLDAVGYVFTVRGKESLIALNEPGLQMIATDQEVRAYRTCVA